MQNLKELFRYIRALYRYRVLFCVVSLLVMTFIGVGSFFMPKIYRADTTVFIERNVIDNLVKGIAVTPSIDDRIRVLKYAILSRDLVTKTLEEINSPIFTRSEAEQQEYISKLIDRTDLRIRGKELFTVSIDDKSAHFAQQYINTLVGLYVEENISAKREETYGANRFLSEQIEVFKAKLEAAEDKIIDFRKKNGIYFNVDEKITLTEIRDLEKQIEKIVLSEDTYQARKRQVRQQLVSIPETIDTVSEAKESSRLGEMETRLSALLLRYTENYPEVIRLKAEIEALKQKLSEPQNQEKKAERTKFTTMNPMYQDLQSQLFEIDAELSSLGAQKLNLQKTIAKKEKELRDVPAARKELNLLVQERDSVKNIYDELLGRMSQSEVSKQMEIGNKAATFRIVDPAVLPKVPVSPNMLKMFLLAIVGGVGCGIGLIFLLENIDTRIRDVETLESAGFDVLAVVPNIVEGDVIRKRRIGNVVLFFSSCVYFLCFSGVFVYVIFIR